MTDNLTGLIWLEDANCFGARTWTNALSDANGLADPACGLTDGSVATDWRLPHLRELSSLSDFAESSPALPSGHPFSPSTGFARPNEMLGIPNHDSPSRLRLTIASISLQLA